MNNDLNSNGKKAKRDPDERVAHMNEIFDKYVLPLILFTVAVFVVFGLLIPGARSCSEKKQTDSAASAREYSSAEFYVRRTDLLRSIASDSDLFTRHGYTTFDDESLRGVAYKVLESGDEIMENVTDPSGNRYSVVMSADSYGKKIGKQNLTLMIYSGSVFLAMAEKEDGMCSAIFDNDRFVCTVSDSDASDSDVSGSDVDAQRRLLEAVPAGEWTRMIAEYKESLTPVLEDVR